MNKTKRDEVTKIEWGLLCRAYLKGRISEGYFLKRSERFAKRLGVA